MNLARFARLAAFFLAASLSLPSIASPSEDADAAYKNGDYASARRLWHELAQQGDASAQTHLGVMYRDGRGVPRDDQQAVEWFRKAAEQGNALGQANLGFMYERGRGARQDDRQAVQWFRKAAEQGNALGQANLGFMYRTGRGGLPQDDQQAINWYRKAAEQGNALGQNNLGVMYRDGRGVAKDDGVAVTWFRKAAEQGNVLGQKNLGAMYEQGRGVAKPDAETVTATPPMSAKTAVGRRADFDVGRITLRMPDDAWESIGAGHRGLPFSGDRSGEIQFETRHLLLRDKAGKFRAALVVGASRGVTTVRMSWTANCQPGKNMHVVDNTRGNLNASDCLRVTGPVPTQRYLELAAPELLADLIGHNVVLPKVAYVVIDEYGIDNGAFTVVRAVFAADFKLPSEANNQDNLPATVKPEAVAWGVRLAEAVRSSIHSLSGTLILPPVTKPD